MANLTQTAANVQLRGTDTEILTVTYGASVTQGMPVYEDTADGEYKAADADALATAAVVGVALTPGGDGQAGIIATSGGIDVGATLTVGALYGISSTAGAIAPIGDLGTGKYETVLGRATAANTLQLDIDISVTAKA